MAVTSYDDFKMCNNCISDIPIKISSTASSFQEKCYELFCTMLLCFCFFG